MPDAAAVVPVSRRVLILDAAAELFAKRGFSRVSLDDIGASAGVTGPAIYRHFVSKEGLLGVILVAISEGLLAGGLERAKTPDAAEAVLASLVDFHVGFALGSPELITLQEREFVHLSTSDARRVRRLQRAYVEVWVTAVQRVHLDLDESSARAATHVAFGLLNSTPHSAAGATLGRPAMGNLLRTMALGALTSAADAAK